MRSNLPDFSSQISHLTASQVLPKVVVPYGDGWAFRAGIGMNHQPPGSSYVSDTVLVQPQIIVQFYSDCLLICFIFK